MSVEQNFFVGIDSKEIQQDDIIAWKHDFYYFFDQISSNYKTSSDDPSNIFNATEEKSIEDLEILSFRFSCRPFFLMISPLKPLFFNYLKFSIEYFHSSIIYDYVLSILQSILHFSDNSQDIIPIIPILAHIIFGDFNANITFKNQIQALHCFTYILLDDSTLPMQLLQTKLIDLCAHVITTSPCLSVQGKALETLYYSILAAYKSTGFCEGLFQNSDINFPSFLITATDIFLQYLQVSIIKSSQETHEQSDREEKEGFFFISYVSKIFYYFFSLKHPSIPELDQKAINLINTILELKLNEDTKYAIISIYPLIGYIQLLSSQPLPSSQHPLLYSSAIPLAMDEELSKTDRKKIFKGLFSISHYGIEVMTEKFIQDLFQTVFDLNFYVKTSAISFLCSYISNMSSAELTIDFVKNCNPEAVIVAGLNIEKPKIARMIFDCIRNIIDISTIPLSEIFSEEIKTAIDDLFMSDNPTLIAIAQDIQDILTSEND